MQIIGSIFKQAQTEMLKTVALFPASIALAVTLLVASARAEEVTLGDPTLTAGVPGFGLLTTQDLATWLGNPDNHNPLTVKLPKGL
ncbi:MAG: cytochrome-c peroxidase, partial [Planctomycetota bacterium]|nr:cytochrome-c peroxidase [Planctomycetota bacterium]